VIALAPISHDVSDEERDMKDSKHTYRIVITFISALFAILLFTTIKDDHGVLKSVMFVCLGVATIWFFSYVVLGSVFRHFYEKGKEEGKEDNSDFV
jgi:hypothetical protein